MNHWRITLRPRPRPWKQAIFVTTVLALCSPLLLKAQTCEPYPIALSAQTLSNAVPGTVLSNIYNGTQPGNFGWLSWGGSPSEPTLVTSLTPPGNSSTYVNPDNPNDHRLVVGDWVSSKPGVSNSKNVRDALNNLETMTITVPVWNQSRGQGASAAYRVSAFAIVRILSYQLPGQNKITAQFLGYANCGVTNQPPVVNAGPDQTITLPAAASLNGLITDDGLPSGSELTASWSEVSGPGTATFSNPTLMSALNGTPITNQFPTTVTFPAPGTYVLQLIASDSQFTSTNNVVITVDRPESPPIAESQSVTLNENTSTNVVLQGSDPDGDPISFVVVTLPNYGTLSGTPPNLTYTPKADFSGQDSFTFETFDGLLYSSNATVSITINPVIVPPVADSESYTNNENTSLPITLSGSDVQGKPLTFQIINGPTNGTLSGTPPNVIYNPASNYFGPDAFTFKDNNGVTDSAPALITITVAPVDEPPLVEAGPGQLIVWPTNTVNLTGSVSYWVFPGTVDTVQWTEVSGPGTVVFGNPSNEVTSATFSQSGLYKLQLMASDSFLSGTDALVVTVDMPPSVSAGPNQTNTLPNSITLYGTAGDDGLPTNGVLTVAWSFVSGPGSVVFSNPNQTNTTVSFSKSGIYDLRLTANDGAASVSSDVTVVANQAPIVDAGSDQTVTNLQAALQGTVFDDGLPNGTLLVNWSQVSGPGMATFANSNSAATTVTFSQTGVYVLQLTANDSLAQSSAEVTITVDGAPVVGVSGDSIVTLPATANLTATATDDGLPVGSTLSYQWTQVSGPGTVTFSAPTALATTASFSTSGVYVIQFAANDTLLTSTTNITVIANQVPTVSAGSAQIINLPQSATLAGTASDDGQPYGTLTTTWSQVSGPGTVTFANPNSAATTASFSASGVYVLQLTANDGVTNSSATVTITANQAPVVSAGPNQLITWPSNQVLLAGSATDDGLPYGTLTTTWTKVSGPGTVTFANPALTNTTATFSAPGVYVLQLTANDGAASTTAQVTITLNQPPNVNAGPAQTILWPSNQVMLSGAASDDGLPSGTLTVSWSKASGPGTVTFANPAATNTAATFSAPGLYVLNLSASDGSASSSSTATITVDQAPSVSLANQFIINWPSNQLTLSGTVSDDGLPVGAVLNQVWTQTNGPGTISFAPPVQTNVLSGTAITNAVSTTATISAPGLYNIQLTADDGVGTNQAVATVIVNQAPTVNAGTAQIILFPNAVTLNGVATDDGLPYGTLATTWTQISGPGTVTFAAPSATNTTATFSAPGVYVLQLTANDGATSGSATVTITANQAPVVSAGPNQLITWPSNQVSLAGSAADDGLPYGTLTTTWTTVSGPGTVTFANSALTNTTATFSAPGVYVLQLAANDGAASTTSQVTITLNQPPNVSAGANQTILWPSNQVTLSGVASDDGLPSGTLTVTWTEVSGPGTVTFANPAATNTTATFSASGLYVLNLSASDGSASSSASTTITVDQAPTVTLPTQFLINWPSNQLALSGTVTDDGLPVGGVLNQVWTQTNGPGTISFAPAVQTNALTGLAITNAVLTTATVSAPGLYNIQLTADDGIGTNQAAATVIVNQAPVVSAGSNQVVTLPQAALLNGTATDDGLPIGQLTYSWTQVSGPGVATFANASSNATTVSFSVAGVYVLQFSANDSAATGTAQVTVRANGAPIAQSQSVAVIEDSSTNIVLQGSDVDGDTVSFAIVSQPQNGTLSQIAPGQYQYTPAATYFGSDSFTFKANDGYVDSAPATVTITVLARNHPPTFTAGTNVTSLQNAGPQTVVGWASNISPGPADESSQTVHFLVNSGNPGLFSAGPSIASNGTLTYTSANNSNGVTTVTVQAQDNGGTSNGGVDTSAAQTFTITIVGPPVLSVPGPQTVGDALPLVFDTNKLISASDPYVGQGTMQLSVSVSNGAVTFGSTNGLSFLSGTNGSSNAVVTGTLSNLNASLLNLTYASVLHYSGADTLSLVINDLGNNGAGSPLTGSNRVSISVYRTNHPPYFVSTPVTNANVYPVKVDGTAQTIGPTNVVNLAPWTVLQYGPFGEFAASWVLSDSNTAATQLTDCDASALISDFSMFRQEIQGTLVTSNTETDLIGFTFGYQNSSNCYIFDWSAADQLDAGALALQGMSVKVVTGNPNGFNGEQLWATYPTNTTNVHTIYHNSIPYQQNVRYNYTLDYQPGNILIQIRQGPTVLTNIQVFDTTYTSGKFGFYDYSQWTTRYAGVTSQQLVADSYTYQSLAVDPDGNPLTYSLVSGPTNMIVNPTNGFIQWYPTTNNVGNYLVTIKASDGQGGVALQTFTINVPPPIINQPPYVFAGPDRAFSGTNTITLNGVALDDGIPTNTPLWINWSKVYGPGNVTFGNSNSPVTSATFSTNGIYVLQLWASDTLNESSNTVTIRANEICTVEPPSGLVAWWSGNLNTNDEVTGVMAKATNIVFPVGMVGPAFLFDGSTSYVDAPAQPGYNVGSNGLSLEFWINPNNFETGSVLGWSNGVRVERVTTSYTGDSLRVFLTGTNSGQYITSPGLWTSSLWAWTHVAVTYDATSGTAAIYINGDLSVTNYVGTNLLSTAGDFYLGHVPGSANFYPGMLDEVSIYSQPLNGEQIYDIFAAGSVGKCPHDSDSPPLVYAGPDLFVTGVPGVATLNGQVTDSDGLPIDSTVHIQWTQLAGPGTVTFASTNSAVTTATFSTNGVYVLKLTADDGEAQSSDVVEVRVEALCTVNDPQGLMAWWPANGSELEALHGYPAIMNGSAGYANGRVGAAFNFDGVDDYIDVPAQTNYNIGSSPAGFSIEWWMNPAAAQNGGVMGWANGVRLERYSSGVSTGDSLHCYICGTNSGQFINAPQVCNGNQNLWTHLVLTYDHMTGWASMYTNGVLYVSNNIGTNVMSTAGDFYMGKVAGSAGVYNGRLDEVSLYARPLNTEEIYSLFTSGSTGKCPDNGNTGPVVSAGPDLFVTGIPGVATLNGQATDDGLPSGSTLHFQWSKFSGPGTVTFSSSTSLTNTATFSTNGVYVLQLTADDGEMQASDLVEVRVEALCTMSDPAGLIAWWPANGNALEVINGYNDALLYNGTGYTNGEVAAAFNFNGYNNYVWMPAHTNYNVGASTNGFTIEFWMNPNSFLSSGVLGWANGVRVERITGGSGSGTEVRFDVAGTGTGQFVTSGQIWTSSTQFNQWYHFALTYNRPTGEAQIFVNGVLNASANVGTNIMSTASDFYLAQVPGAPAIFSGRLDEISLYARPLTEAEIVSVYRSGSVGKCPENGNQPPTVYAGPDQSLASTNVIAELHGIVFDDGLPLGGVLQSQWTMLDGPGLVTFANPNSPATTAMFSTNGIYTLQLAANDGEQQSSSLMQVRVGMPCGISNIPGLVAWWTGNSNSIDRITGFPAIMVNGAGYTSGKVASAFNFTGNGGNVFIPAQTNYDIGSSTNGFTIEFWIKTGSAGNGQGMLSWNNSSEGGANTGISMTEGGVSMTWNIPNANGGSHTITVQNVFNGNWLHVALTYNRSTGVAGVYLNGVLQSAPNIGSFQPQTGYDLVFGQVPGINPFSGQLDEISLYTRPLAQSEIQSIFNAGALGKCATASNMPPVLTPGPNQTISFPTNTVTLNGIVGDDGLPSNTLFVAWSYVSGPSTVFFSSTNTPVTTVTFTNIGTYTFNLSASDGQLSTNANVTVTVLPDLRPRPVVSITSPANGSLLPVPVGGTTNLTITATASSADAPITNVEFYLNGADAGSSTNAPYSLNIPDIAPSTYSITAVAMAADGLSTTSAPVTTTLYYDAPPEVGIFTPADSTIVTAPTNIIGIASSPILQSWQLRYRLAPAATNNSIPTDSTGWGTLASGSTSLVSNTLATFDPTMLLNGIYQVQVVATDLQDRTSYSEVTTLVVDRNLKLGNFILGFNDLSVPVPGLPLQVTRTYDSRAAAAGMQGDFGIGWTMDILNVRLQKNRPLGNNWTETVSGDVGQLTTSYHLDSGTPRIVTITFPDGRVEKFQLVPNPMDQPLAAIEFPQWRFVALDNTKGTLVPSTYNEVDGNFLWVIGGVPGTVDLYDLNYFSDNPDATQEQLNDYPTSFLYTSPDGYKYVIDEIQGLQSASDPNGNTLLISTNGLIWTNSAAGTNSLAIAFQRDTQGRITNIVDALGNSLHYNYSTNGDLIEFQNRDGDTNAFTYGSNDRLLTVIDARGAQVVNNTYDGSGRLIATTDASGNSTSSFYDTGNQRSYTTNRLGYVSIKEYDLHGNITRTTDPLGGVTSFVYDEDGNLLAKTNALGGVQLYTYDGNDDKLSETDPNGNTTVYTYNNLRKILTMVEPSGFGTTNTYDANGNLLSMTDAADQLATFTYNSMGKVTSMTDSKGTTTYQYDQYGNLAILTDPLGHVTQYTADANGHVTSQTIQLTQITGLASLDKARRGDWLLAGDPLAPTAVTNVGQLVMRFEYTPGGLPLRTIYYDGTITQTSNGIVTDPLGRLTACENNTNGWTVRKTYPDGCSDAFQYDAEGELIATFDKRGFMTQFQYDPNGKITRTIYPDGSQISATYYPNGSLQSETSKSGEVTTYGIDANGNRTSVTDSSGTTTYTYNYRGHVTSMTDPLGRKTAYVYDGLARNIEIDYPDGSKKTSTFSGKLVTSITDQDGHTTRYAYDAVGHLMKITDPLGGVTTYTYDENGDRVSATDPLGNTTYFEYDTMRRLTRTDYPDGSTVSKGYDLVGRLVAQTNQLGDVTTYEYDAGDRLVKTTDPMGRVTTSSYDCDDNKVSQTAPDGKVTSFAYDNLNRLTSTTFPCGTTAINTYSLAGRLTAQTDQAGKVTTFDYYINDRLKSVTDPLGNTTVFTYDAVGNRTSQTDPLNNVTSYGYDAVYRLISTTHPDGGVEGFAYDPVGHITSYTDQVGHTSTMTYDATGRLTKDTDALGDSIQCTYDIGGNRLTRIDRDGKTTTYHNDVMHRVTSTTYPDGSTQSTTYDKLGLPAETTDALGKETTYAFNADGQRSSITDPLGHTTQYSYDSGGRLASITDANNATTSFTYDCLGHLSRTTYPDGSSSQTVYDNNGKPHSQTDPNGNSTTFAYDDAGRLTSQTDPLGNITSYAYDALGRLQSRTDALGRITRYQYDDLGNCTNIIYPDNTSTSATYDAKSRLITTTDARGHVTTRDYDDQDRLVASIDALNHTTQYGYDPMSRLTSVTDANSHTTDYTYDTLGRLTQTTYADGTTSASTYDFDGRQLTQTDQDGNTKHYAYDDVGRLSSVTDALGGVSSFGYDPVGRMTNQTDAAGRITAFTYNVRGWRSQRTLPGGQTETLSYDNDGNVTARTSFKGNTTTYLYDALSRLTNKIPDAQLVGAVPVTFTYNAVGDRTQMTDASGATAYAYDVMDRVLAKQTPEGTIGYAYNPNGSVTGIVSSNLNGSILSYNYDAVERLSTVTDGLARQTAYAYDPAGNLIGSAQPNGLSQTMAYDALNRLTAFATVNAQQAPFASYQYTLDPAGQRRSAIETVGAATINRTFGYDPLYRLTNESISVTGQLSTLQYTYDSVGNRLARNSTVPNIPSTTYAYDANDRLASDGYDANGNTTNAWVRDPLSVLTNHVSDTFDFEDNLTARETTINGQSVTVSLVYDGDGNRVRKTIASGTNSLTTYYLVDDQNPSGYAQVLDELQSSALSPQPFVTRVYTYGLSLLSEEQVLNNTWVTSYYGYDGHGSVRYLTDTNGVVTDTYDYDAFGNLIGQSVLNRTTAALEPLSVSNSAAATPNNFLFNGEQFDPDLNFYYQRARYADPDRGRFWTPDHFEGSIDDPPSWHKYTFCANDPVNNVDPSGYDTMVEELGVSTFQPLVRAMVMQLFNGVNNASYALAGGTALKATSSTEAYMIDALEQGPGWQMGRQQFVQVIENAPFLLCFNPNIVSSPTPYWYNHVSFDLNVPIYGPCARSPIFELSAPGLLQFLNEDHSGWWESQRGPVPQPVWTDSWWHNIISPAKYAYDEFSWKFGDRLLQNFGNTIPGLANVVGGGVKLVSDFAADPGKVTTDLLRQTYSDAVAGWNQTVNGIANGIDLTVQAAYDATQDPYAAWQATKQTAQQGWKDLKAGVAIVGDKIASPEFWADVTYQAAMAEALGPLTPDLGAAEATLAPVEHVAEDVTGAAAAEGGELAEGVAGEGTVERLLEKEPELNEATGTALKATELQLAAEEETAAIAEKTALAEGEGAAGFTKNPWSFITDAPTKEFPEARFSFYGAARSEEFAANAGLSRIGAANRAEYAQFLQRVRSASFRESNWLQGGFAGVDTATGDTILGISRGNLDSPFALNHELTHLVRDFKGITPFEAEENMRGIYRYRAWIEEGKTYFQQFFGPPE